jgi:hypothetical protein
MGSDVSPADDEALDSGDDRRESRRRLIRRAATAGAIAWTVPLVIDGITNPAAAATCAKGNFYVAYTGNLSTATAGATTCPATAGYTLVTPASIGLTAAWSGGASSVDHIASTTGNIGTARFTIAGCSCTIRRVMGRVHLKGPGDCPPLATFPNRCVNAGTSLVTNHLVASVAPGVGVTTLTVQPNQTTNLCTATAIHWGSDQGTVAGYLLVEVVCT